MRRFRITLRRFFDTPKRILQANLFFSDEQKMGGKLIEVGEAKILEIELSEECINRLKRGYIQPLASDAVRSFVEHQLGYGSSLQSWTSTYARFLVDNVKELKK